MRAVFILALPKCAEHFALVPLFSCSIFLWFLFVSLCNSFGISDWRFYFYFLASYWFSSAWTDFSVLSLSLVNLSIYYFSLSSFNKIREKSKSSPSIIIFSSFARVASSFRLLSIFAAQLVCSGIASLVYWRIISFGGFPKASLKSVATRLTSLYLWNTT